MRGGYGYRDNDNLGEDLLRMTGNFINSWEKLDNYIDNEHVQAAQGKLLQRAKERGGDLSSLSFEDIENVYDMQALGQLQQQNSQNEQYRLQGMQRRAAADTEYYNQKIYPAMSLLKQAYESGDTAAFDALAPQVGNLLGTPYRFKLGSDGQNFDEYFRSDAGMGFTPTGRKLTREDIYNITKQTVDGTQFVASGIGGQPVAVNQQYNLWAERQRQATARGNIENALAPKPMVGPNGKLYYAAAQNKWGDYNADTDILLFDQQGKKLGVFGASQLGRGGYRWATAQDAKKARGAGGAGGVAGVLDPKKNPALAQAMARQGMGYDKETRLWYPFKVDEEGKRTLDFNAPPASDEQLMATLQKLGLLQQRSKKGTGGGRVVDPLGVRGRGSSAVPGGANAPNVAKGIAIDESLLQKGRAIEEQRRKQQQSEQPWHSTAVIPGVNF